MSRSTASLPPAYFDERYGRDPDPWRFATSGYERAKYAATLDALPRARYRAALEVGCSIGVLTKALAGRCERVLGVDVADLALDQARERCRDLPQATFAKARVPQDWPAGRFDLILLSEVVYYLVPDDVDRLAIRVRDSLDPGGDVVLVHWTGETDYPMSGDGAARRFVDESAGFARVLHQVATERYRLDVLRAAES